MPQIVKLTTLVAAAMLMAGPLAAQGRGRAGTQIPSGYEPPAGMCRVWLSGVPASQQPAPTDCATAIRKRTENAVVVFGQPLRDARQPLRDDDQRRVPAVRDLRRPAPAEPEAPPPDERRRTERPVPADRGNREPAPTADRPRTRAEPPKQTARPRSTPAPRKSPPRGRPPDTELESEVASARWLDTELLATLYGSPPGAMRDVRRPDDDGRATPRQQAGERGRLRSADRVGTGDTPLPWAVSPSGERLTALEVERMLRLQLAYDGVALADDGRVDARPGECYDRDFDGRCDDLSTGADGCFDQNRDGRCDDARWDHPAAPGGRVDPRRRAGYDGGAGADPYGLCFDRDRDGRCDEPWTTGRRIPQTLPEMAAAVRLQRGVASYDVERWLHRSDLQARVTDRDGDGLPERVTWLDPSGRVVQSWTDRDGDGIADRVELFRDGLPVQVIGR